MWYSVSNQTIDFTANITYLSFLDAAKYTIELIQQRYPPPYQLMVSGGVDSQAMLYLWHLYGKNFVPVTVSYNNGLNDHDIDYIRQFTHLHGIGLTVKQFDLLNFYDNEYPDVCEKYKCISPHFGAHYGMSRDLPGTVILSGDTFFDWGIIPIKSNNIWLLDVKRERSIIPFFFSETAELAYSIMYDAANHKIRSDHEYPKVNYYRSAGIPVIPQTQKYTGFEQVKDYYDVHYAHLVTAEMKRRFILKPSRRVYDVLLRYPYEQKHGVVNYSYLLNRDINVLGKLKQEQ
jgi:hypothetical protein